MPSGHKSRAAQCFFFSLSPVFSVCCSQFDFGSSFFSVFLSFCFFFFCYRPLSFCLHKFVYIVCPLFVVCCCLLRVLSIPMSILSFHLTKNIYLCVNFRSIPSLRRNCRTIPKKDKHTNKNVRFMLVLLVYYYAILCWDRALFFPTPNYPFD